MDNIKILCVEDEETHLARLEMLIDKLDYQLVGTASNALDALELFYERKPDIILMDIHLDGELDGIELARRLVQKKPVPLLFITSFNDDATFQRAQAVQPFAYIIKPFDAQQLARTIELAVSTISQKPEQADFEKGVLSSDKLFFKINNKLKRIELPQVLYLQAEGRYSAVNTTERRRYVLRLSLSELLGHLPEDQFMRIHRSYAVQLSHIEEVDLTEQTIQVGQEVLPFSRSHRESLLNRLPWLS